VFTEYLAAPLTKGSKIRAWPTATRSFKMHGDGTAELSQQYYGSDSPHLP
jgi:hypothetical protein